VEDILLGQLVGDILQGQLVDILEQLEEDILLGLLVEDTLQGQLVGDKELYSVEDILALEDKELGIGMEEAEFCHPL